MRSRLEWRGTLACLMRLCMLELLRGMRRDRALCAGSGFAGAPESVSIYFMADRVPDCCPVFFFLFLELPEFFNGTFFSLSLSA